MTAQAPTRGKVIPLYPTQRRNAEALRLRLAAQVIAEDLFIHVLTKRAREAAAKARES